MNHIQEQTVNGTLFNLHLCAPQVYADNESRDRSGHLGHAMVLTKTGKLLDFNANTSAYRSNGHSAFGWMEYRVSEDHGVTFSEARPFPFSVDEFLKGRHTVSIEKAVCCEDNTVVAFILHNSQKNPVSCEPWGCPLVTRSFDDGETWTEPVPLCEYAGRVYDARYYDGKIYVLENCNDASIFFCGNLPEHQYRLFVSEDFGKTFREESVVDFGGSENLGYGEIIRRADGSLIAYAYNVKDEKNLRYALSRDDGKTWCEHGVCRLDQQIRNPQVNILEGQYILFGRKTADYGAVIYTSADGIRWSCGTVLNEDNVSCYYSNTILLDHPGRPGEKRLLVQYSEVYPHPEPREWNAAVNVYHMWVEKA